jgi:nitrate/nitrite transport system substrate-binding protein
MTDRLTHRTNRSRRALLKQGAAAAGTASLFTAIRAAFPAGAFAEAAEAPEITKATFGFIALTDASPLIVAREKGFFKKYGMTEVEVAKQASWGTTRDNIELGSDKGGIDGAHILTPMPYMISAGKVTKNNQPVPMNILLRLNTNGQAISVTKDLLGKKIEANAPALKEEVAKLKAAGKDPKAAMTFRGGTHDVWIRYWLAANGVDPEKDLSCIVVPPPQMVANMKVGSMHFFCVGEPWNAQLIHQKIGFSALTTQQLWVNHPEKCLGVRADWVEKHPKAAMAVTKAVMEAQIWCDKPENKKEMCEIVSRRSWFNVPVDDIIGRTSGEIDYGDGRKLAKDPNLMKYWADFASYPFPSHDLWFLTENIRWGIYTPDTDIAAMVKKVNREDVWRGAAKALSIPAAQIPATTSRGKETFFDGKVFDPENPKAYLASLAIKKLAV